MLTERGEVRAVARERHRLSQHPVRRADQPSQPGSDLQAPHAQIKMAPVRHDRAHVVAMRRAERAPRAHQPPAAQHDLHDDSVALEANIADMHPLQAQQARECGGGAHGTIDLQIAGLDTRDPTADPVRVSQPRPHQHKDPAQASNQAAAPPTSRAGAPVFRRRRHLHVPSGGVGASSASRPDRGQLSRGGTRWTSTARRRSSRARRS